MARRKTERPQSRSPEQTADSAYDLFAPAKRCKAAKLQWLLPGRLVAGALAVIEGDPTSGKSTFLAALAGAVSSGESWAGRPKQRGRGVLWLAGEEDAATMVRPRLAANRADLARVHFPTTDSDGQPRRIEFPRHCGQLLHAATELNVGLVVVDPLVTYAAQGLDLNNEVAARSLVDALGRVAAATGATIVLTRHLRKDRNGPPMLWGVGSIAIAAAARCVLRIERPEPRDDGRRAVVVKCNAAPRTPALLYRLDFTSGVPVIVGAHDDARADGDEDDDAPDRGERDVRQDARQLLRQRLGTEFVAVSAIVAEAAGAGIGERTLRRAKADLGVRSRRLGDEDPPRWEWGPPEGGWSGE